VPHGGWCPRGRKAEDGRIPDRYHVQETESPDYLERTRRNVEDSDATLVFTLGRPSGGSLRTIEFAHAAHKPWHHIDVAMEWRERVAPDIVSWLEGKTAYDFDEYEAKPPSDCVLNVAGTRESNADGMESLVTTIMVDVLRTVNPECRGLYPVRE
jgi:hypothetical protein